jgi:hypothetical protein
VKEFSAVWVERVEKVEAESRKGKGGRMKNRRMGATEVDWREEGDFDYCVQPIVELLVNRPKKNK